MSGWTGWEKERALVTDHADRIDRRLRRISVPMLVALWLRVTKIPQRVGRGEVDSFLMSALGGKLDVAFGHLLDELWQDAWVLGVSAAKTALPDESRFHVQISKGKTRCDAGHAHGGAHGAAGLLIRSRNQDGKRLYLLHKRGLKSDFAGTWAVPGGSLHPGESPMAGALRETKEELGPDLPRMKLSHTVTDDHGGWAYTTHVMDMKKPYQPRVDGETPKEVGGWGWFTKKEIKRLKLHGGFKNSWKTTRQAKGDVVINSAMTVKGALAGARMRPWRRPMQGVRRAPLGPDRWHDVRDSLLAEGIPPVLAGPLSSEFITWENYTGATALIGVIATITGRVGDVLQRLTNGEISRAAAIAEIRGFISDPARIMRIAVTEAARAINEAARQSYWLEDVTYVTWQTAEDGDQCEPCQQNERQGEIPLNDTFSSGDTVPPAHPHCRCVILPVPQEPQHDLYGSGGVITKSPETPVVSTVHHRLGTHGLWHTPDRHVSHQQQLPAYIQNIAHALMRDEGMEESQAIATAINAVKRWARGDLHWGHRKVTPEVIVASRRALEEWEGLRASHKSEELCA